MTLRISQDILVEVTIQWIILHERLACLQESANSIGLIRKDLIQMKPVISLEEI